MATEAAFVRRWTYVGEVLGVVLSYTLLAHTFPVFYLAIPIVLLLLSYLDLTRLWTFAFSTTYESTTARWTIVYFALYNLFAILGLVKEFSPIPVCISIFSTQFLYLMYCGRKEHEDPELIHRNRLPMHVPLASYANEEMALTNDRFKSANVKLLNSTTDWSFKLYPTPEAVPQFWKDDFDRSDFVRTTVPSNWELEGHSFPIYTNIKHPIQTAPPFTPKYDNPTGCYIRRFDVPEDWLEEPKKITVTLHGAASCFYVYVNGVEVGMSKDSRLAAEFDMSSVVRAKDNLLAVKVLRWCDACPFLEDQDHWYLSGIHRDVEISAKPQACIEDYRVGVSIGDASTDASVTVDVSLSEGQSSKNKVVFRLRRRNSSTIIAEETIIIDAATSCGAKLMVPDAKLWSAEEPNLYSLTISLVDESNNVIESEGCRVGLREVHVENGILLVNGKRVLLKGVNRHDHDERTGKVVTVESMKEDIVMMKQFNFNAVRTSHYPNDNRFYDLCDELGMYVYDEANIECHGDTIYRSTSILPNNRIASDPAYRDAFLSRVARMAKRDWNHSSIIVWSLGNESGVGPNLLCCRQWLATNDCRPVQYEGGNSPENLSDFIAPMYMGVEDIKKTTKHNPTRPLILCEYAHSMGNSCGNLDEYWEAFRSNKSLQGGFIWDWMDQGLIRRDAQGRESYAYGGDFGETVHDGNFNINGLLFPDRTPHPALYEAKKCQQPVQFKCVEYGLSHVVLEIFNENLFVDLHYLDFTWEIVVDGKVVVTDLVVPVTPKTIGPQETCRVTLRYDEWIMEADAAAFGRWINVYAKLNEDTCWAKKGHLIALTQLQVNDGCMDNVVAPQFLHRNRTCGTLKVESRNESNITTVEGNNFSVAFDRASGLLTSLQLGQSELLKELDLCFFRAPTDNDTCGGTMPLDMPAKIRAMLPGSMFLSDKIIEYIRNAQSLISSNSYAYLWRLSGLDRLVRSVRSVKMGKEDGVSYSWSSLAEYGQFIAGNVDVTTFKNGLVSVAADVVADESLPVLPRVGLHLKLPEKYHNVEMLARGPHENYIDRKESATVGLWKATVDELHVPYLRPTENGGREDVKFVSLTADDGEGLLVVPTSRSAHMSVSRYSVAEIDHAEHQEELVAENSDVIHLHIDHAHMGLGGETSWSPNVREADLVHPGRFTFGAFLMPIEKGQDPSVLAHAVASWIYNSHCKQIIE